MAKRTAVFHCSICGTIVSEKTCGHSNGYRTYVSMTKIRDMLRRGRMPSSDIIRPEIADILMRTYSSVG
ncbi:MAG: hypothetical protein Q9N34_03280 [Aquificota bacterium]|nr:hypothetical protein [Aquificota bacterium]